MLVMMDNDDDRTLQIMENILFENKYGYTLALLRKWSGLSFKRSGRHMLWLQLVLKAIVFATAIAIALLAVLYDYFFLFIPAEIFLLAGIIMVLLPRRYTQNQYNSFLQLQLQPQAQLFRTIRFGDSIEVICGNTVTSYLYEQIPYVEENDNCFCLWINGTAFLAVYKNAFEMGDTESFRTFILDKCSRSQPLITKSQFNQGFLKRHWARVITLAVLVFLLLAICLLLILQIPNTAF